MSNENDIPIVLKVLLAIISTIIGIVLGAVIGFYGLYYLCLTMDTMDGASPGGAVGAGWAFLFFTVPIGMLVGGGLGCCLPLYILREKE